MHKLLMLAAWCSAALLLNFAVTGCTRAMEEAATQFEPDRRDAELKQKGDKARIDFRKKIKSVEPAAETKGITPTIDGTTVQFEQTGDSPDVDTVTVFTVAGMGDNETVPVKIKALARKQEPKKPVEEKPVEKKPAPPSHPDYTNPEVRRKLREEKEKQLNATKPAATPAGPKQETKKPEEKKQAAGLPDYTDPEVRRKLREKAKQLDPMKTDVAPAGAKLPLVSPGGVAPPDVIKKSDDKKSDDKKSDDKKSDDKKSDDKKPDDKKSDDKKPEKTGMGAPPPAGLAGDRTGRVPEFSAIFSSLRSKHDEITFCS